MPPPGRTSPSGRTSRVDIRGVARSPAYRAEAAHSARPHDEQEPDAEEDRAQLLAQADEQLTVGNGPGQRDDREAEAPPEGEEPRECLEPVRRQHQRED